VTTVSTSTPKKPARAKVAHRAPGRRLAGTATDTTRRICNVVPSKDTQNDWQFADSVNSGALAAPRALPASVDLRAPWWAINDQESTGSCVGWATGDGVVRYLMTQAGRISGDQLLSPRHVWMASKETDTIVARPETFIEEAGTTLKAAMDVARKTGVALMTDLPFHISTNMYLGDETTFYANCAQRKISAYFNLHKDPGAWMPPGTGPRPMAA
jgi:hypothetical protein